MWPVSRTRALAAGCAQAAAIAGAAELSHGGRAVPWVAIAAIAVAGGVVAVMASGRLFDRDRGRIRRLAGTLAAVRAGDLTVRNSSNRRDELGEVERGVDELVGRMVAIVGTLQQGLDRFHTAWLGVSSIHKEMLDTAEMTAGQAYDAGVSAQQVSDSIHVVASATEELAATVNDIERHAAVAADIAISAAEQGQFAESGVRDLTTAMRDVEEIADVISAIAGQTHLLALNAKIEAARAGEAGLGFGVVAAEVRALSKATADATEQVRAIVSGIQAGSLRASDAIGQITGTMSLICESTSSIAAAVSQQTATTQEIGRVSVTAAGGAQDISGRVSAVHNRAREVAYVGARNDAAGADEFANLETAFRTVIEGYRVGSFAATIGSSEVDAVDQAKLNELGTTTAGGITTVLDTVIGSGLNEFAYTGAWLHGNGYETDPGGDAYCSVPGDKVELRFVGRKLRFTGCKDKQQGMAEVWVDGHEPTLIDFYSPDRAHTMLWESPDLSPGEHTFHLVVSPKKNPQSRYFWVSLAKVEIFP
jgi:methyl-accepting chemotaxis protein